MANAEENFGVSRDNLVVYKITADESAHTQVAQIWRNAVVFEAGTAPLFSHHGCAARERINSNAETGSNPSPRLKRHQEKLWVVKFIR